VKSFAVAKEHAMGTHLLINVTDEQELRVCRVTDGRLESLIHERQLVNPHAVGNIYKARVANVEPSLDAAFVELDGTKNGFIHVDDVIHDKGPKARIEDVLKKGQEVLVQITKEPIRDKGACVTMYLRLAGRYLVLMSDSDKNGVSKKIDDVATRRRLKQLLGGFPIPEGFGLILRTAAAERTDEEIKIDFDFLSRVWSEIKQRADRMSGSLCLFQEEDAVLRTMRDLSGDDLEGIVIDREDVYDETRAFADVFMPELASKIQLHRDAIPLFTYYGIDERLETTYDRRVHLPSGGNIVIEQTEALVSIDVNSSKSREGKDVAATALNTNLEAAAVISEQLLLRDLGGLVIVDFIDMESRDDQRLVQLALRKELAADPARTFVAPMSKFGLVELTRQRRRPNHRLISHATCPHCRGTGQVKTADTFEIDCMRAIRIELTRKKLTRLEVVVPPSYLPAFFNHRRAELQTLEQEFDTRIVFSADAQMTYAEYRLAGQAQKRGRSRGGKPVRPSLLAPLFAERAQAAQAARDLAQRNLNELESEVGRLEQGIDEEAAAAATALNPAPAAPAPAKPPTVYEEAAVLRELLFSASPVRYVADVTSGLAKEDGGATSPARARGRSRPRRRSGRRS
jgi:ribonuclease E